MRHQTKYPCVRDQDLWELKRTTTPELFAKTLCAAGPLCFWASNGLWVVSDSALAKHALRHPKIRADRTEFFANRLRNLGRNSLSDFFAVTGRFMVMSDGAAHQARRKIAAHALSDELVDRFTQIVDGTVETLLKRRATSNSFDLVSTVARDLPAIVLADLFQIPQPERNAFTAWANTMTEFFGPADNCDELRAARVNKAATQLRAYFQRMLEARREIPEDDFLGRMVNKQNDFDLLDAELVSQAILMLVAGSVTTSDQICNNAFTLLSNQGAYQELRKEPKKLATALEELNRLDPAVSFLFRVTDSSIELGGISLPAGAPIFISLHAINRDPSLFPAPHACKLDRSPNPHFSFGHGAHYCLGARLGRLQMQAVFQALLRLFPTLALNPDQPAERDHYSLAFSGFRHLSLRV